MTEISVKAKLWGLIALMLLFIISVGAVGFVTLDRQADLLRNVLERDEALVTLVQRMHLNLIQLRRFEKDYFLNIDNPNKQQEYLEKYQKIAGAMPTLIRRLQAMAQGKERLAQDAAIRSKTADLAGHYRDYRAGFEAAVQRLQADPRLTPQQANAFMASYKGNIPILEEEMDAVSEAVDQMMAQVAARSIQKGREARILIAVVVLAAVVLAGLLGSALCRSIYRAIFREGLRRMAHRI
jgi:methyl-accepting chemotaxis protein